MHAGEYLFRSVKCLISTQGAHSATTADRCPAPCRYHGRRPLVNFAGLDDDVVLLQHGDGFGRGRRSGRGSRRWPGMDVVMRGDTGRSGRGGQRRWGGRSFRTAGASVLDERWIGDDGRWKRAKEEGYQLAEQSAQEGLVDDGRDAIVGPFEGVLERRAEHVIQVNLCRLKRDK